MKLDTRIVPTYSLRDQPAGTGPNSNNPSGHGARIGARTARQIRCLQLLQVQVRAQRSTGR